MIAKKKTERDILEEGGARLARHLKELARLVKPGVYVKTLEDEARSRVLKDGDELAFLGYTERRGGSPYPSGLCVSVNDVIVHSPAGENTQVFKEGDVVSLDFGIRHRGLYTDSAVTIIAGSPAKEDERLVRGTKEALEAGIAEAIVGNTTGHIGEAVERIATQYGFGFPRNLGGHGVGRVIHEEPHIHNFGKAGDGSPLVLNMVIAIEPMMTLGGGELVLDSDGHSYRTRDGSRSAHFEHTVLVTRAGPKVLTA